MTLNKNTVILGTFEDNIREVEDHSVDLIFADLPYGITHNAWDEIIDTGFMWEHFERVLKEKGTIILTADMSFAVKLLSPVYIKEGVCLNNFPKSFSYYDLVWVKGKVTGFLNANRRPLRQHENIIVAYKGSHNYNPQFTAGSPYSMKNGKPGKGNYNDYKREMIINQGTRHPTSLQYFPQHINTVHPTQKPIALCEWIVKSFSNEGDLVLDPTCGSGSSLVASKRLGRSFIGIERDQEYYNVTMERLNNVTDNLFME